MQNVGANKHKIAVVTLALLAAVLFCARFGASLETAQYVAMTGLLAWASAKDLETRTIPNRCVLLAVGVRAAYFALLAVFGRFAAGECLYYAASGVGVGIALALFCLAFERVTGREGMGGGDVKLYALAGLFLGVEGAAYVVLLSCVIALVAVLLTRSSHGGQGVFGRSLPFGPAIAVAFVIVALG